MLWLHRRSGQQLRRRTDELSALHRNPRTTTNPFSSFLYLFFVAFVVIRFLMLEFRCPFGMYVAMGTLSLRERAIRAVADAIYRAGAEANNSVAGKRRRTCAPQRLLLWVSRYTGRRGLNR